MREFKKGDVVRIKPHLRGTTLNSLELFDYEDIMDKLTIKVISAFRVPFAHFEETNFVFNLEHLELLPKRKSCI